VLRLQSLSSTLRAANAGRGDDGGGPGHGAEGRQRWRANAQLPDGRVVEVTVPRPYPPQGKLMITPPPMQNVMPAATLSAFSTSALTKLNLFLFTDTVLSRYSNI